VERADAGGAGGGSGLPERINEDKADKRRGSSIDFFRSK
jgi:hypothetical protein